jgi:hypothetical protein
MFVDLRDRAIYFYLCKPFPKKPQKCVKISESDCLIGLIIRNFISMPDTLLSDEDLIANSGTYKIW